MGLAGVKTKIKYGKDPRNTAWSTDTDRFGHKHLERLGWAPGQSLGTGSSGVDGMTSHVKVAIKTDNTGLGRKSARKSGVSEMDSEVTTGLDVFQRLLGRLNGKTDDQIENQMQDQKKRIILSNPRFGMVFVHGGVLEGSVEKMMAQSDDSSKKKRKRSDDEEKKEKKSKKEKKDKKDKSDKKDKKDKKKKKEKKEKKSKKSKQSDEEDESSSSSSGTPSASSSGTSTPRLRGRQATRMRFIAQKRAATADIKALNEILMVQA
ncbi:protein Pxr1p [Trichomonascus vanleenenianus]|uniref:telomerase inhibitor n=1 Tax=Trichomonascus vanleenenianus TaxID=2268995 RepID=UPI003ECA5670